MIRPKERWIGGVCSAISKSSGFEPIVIRISFLIFSLPFFILFWLIPIPIFIYLILWLLIPNFKPDPNIGLKYLRQSLGAIAGGAIGFPLFLSFDSNIITSMFYATIGLITGTMLGLSAVRFQSERQG